MANRVPIAICLTLGAAFLLGSGCVSIPDHRNTVSDGVSGGNNGPDSGIAGSGAGAGGAGNAGGSNGGSGTGATGNGGSGTGATGSGGRASGGTGNGGRATGGAGGGRVVGVDGGPDGSAAGLPCGPVKCFDRTVGHVTYPACCASITIDKCGLDTTVNGGPGCIEPAQAGTIDKNEDVCKSQMSSDGTTYSGCCRSSGKCGVEYQLAGGPNFGCVDPTELEFPAGKTCTPPVCTAAGGACKNSSECCSGPAGEPVCATLDGTSGSVCSDYCVTNGDCASGCCVTLVSGRGACAPNASSCSAMCRKVDETCDKDNDCCTGYICAPNSDFGPRLCRPPCNTNATCAPEFCVKDDTGRGSCSTSGAGLCSDTCSNASDGSCEDSGDSKTVYSDCALGTDCSDCGGTTKVARLGGTTLCFDSCATHGNGICEDGGPGSSKSTCAFGNDCTDCKPRLGLCSNSCEYAFNGECEDGGPLALYGDCAEGTDCADCGVRFGGRNQGLCDGTKSNTCQPGGGVLNYDIEDGTCQCPDCPWDAVDCKVTASKCDGRTLGACCAPNNPCKIQYDGICSCGGWCDWETPDCGSVFPTPYCDGTTISADCDITMPTPALKGNGVCDCKGACSWEQADCTKLGTLCFDDCSTAKDGRCADDDVTCPYGHDCADCGPRYPH